MGIGLRHVDMDKWLEGLNGDVIFLNDLDPTDDIELIRRLTITVYDDSTFSLIPSCNCGVSNLKDHPEKQVGDLCDYCLTTVEVQTQRKLKSVIWIKPPEGIKKLINPSFLTLLLETVGSEELL